MKLVSDNPYVGLRPFQPEEHHLFFGRGLEIDTLISLVLAHRVVLVYGVSGIGKSSLINVGLIPGLLREGVEVLSPARVGARSADLDTREVRNVFAASVIASLAPTADPAQLRGASIGDFLAGLARSPERTTRLLIFDQFEDLFRLYPDRWRDREEFFVQLGEALATDRSLGAIFSMREDYIAQLDTYLDLIPGRFRIRFRLEALRAPAALEAVRRPLEKNQFRPRLANCKRFDW